MADDLRSAVASAVRARRTLAGLTQGQLAGAMGVDQAVISRIEAAVRPIPLGDELVRLCEQLGCTLRQLLEDANPEQRRALGIRD
ncbi:helix-turn-helix domain-containing protein [Kineosporia succinea]|uniref:Transcriptional regulator with XRE-family HTH domain n=1 Tax=Kineosporia succinea TaxID=84632 RepID=A0ABT9P9K4_9ACTN|nr:helix-turn-helix transcriptional regulator [Kineosporia succinea]MDP9829374.1 transcriptional regulator with XRE-family HTH domain [Kineosporia succinea]